MFFESEFLELLLSHEHSAHSTVNKKKLKQNNAKGLFIGHDFEIARRRCVLHGFE